MCVKIKNWKSKDEIFEICQNCGMQQSATGRGCVARPVEVATGRGSVARPVEVCRDAFCWFFSIEYVSLIHDFNLEDIGMCMICFIARFDKLLYKNSLYVLACVTTNLVDVT